MIPSQKVNLSLTCINFQHYYNFKIQRKEAVTVYKIKRKENTHNKPICNILYAYTFYKTDDCKF